MSNQNVIYQNLHQTDTIFVLQLISYYWIPTKGLMSSWQLKIGQVSETTTQQVLNKLRKLFSNLHIKFACGFQGIGASFVAPIISCHPFFRTEIGVRLFWIWITEFRFPSNWACLHLSRMWAFRIGDIKNDVRLPVHHRVIRCRIGYVLVMTCPFNVVNVFVCNYSALKMTVFCDNTVYIPSTLWKWLLQRVIIA